LSDRLEEISESNVIDGPLTTWSSSSERKA